MAIFWMSITDDSFQHIVTYIVVHTKKAANANVFSLYRPLFFEVHLYMYYYDILPDFKVQRIYTILCNFGDVSLYRCSSSYTADFFRIVICKISPPFN